MSEKITMKDGKLCVPENPVIPYIEGDGTGPDITRAAMTVWNAAVEKAYGGKRKIEWKEVLAGEKAFKQTGEWLPQATLDACRENSFRSRARSRLLSAAESGPSTSRCARSSTSTYALGLSAGSREFLLL